MKWLTAVIGLLWKQKEQKNKVKSNVKQYRKPLKIKLTVLVIISVPNI